MLKIEDLVNFVNLEKLSTANKNKKKLKKYLTTSDKHVILLITTRGMPWKRK